MACPDDSTWLRYLGGALAADELNELEQHLDVCGECRLLYAAVAKGTEPTGLPARPIRIADLVHPTELVRGALVERYVILGTLGRGGMGVVYKAFDPELDRPIALKLVSVTGTGAEAEPARARLLREAKTLAQLSHPNVVAVYDVGSYQDDVFVAMEFVAGATLRHWLDGKRTPREILDVFRAAGAGLAAAHRLGIVHRDFKPENVMVADDGRVRVLDFGLARMEGRSELTRDGAILGTPAYMAPEQDRGRASDGRSDQFSFCAALYEALFGQRAFAGATYEEIASHRREGVIAAAPNVRGVSHRVRRAVLQGLRAEPAARHASMDALLAELGGPRRRVKVAFAALAATSVLAAGWAIWVRTHEAPTADEMCASAASEIARVWNPHRRDELYASLDAMHARPVAARVVQAADRYAAEWTAQRVQVCKLLVSGDGTRARDPLTSQRLDCLKHRLTTLDGTASAFIHAPSKNLVEHADAVLAGLEPVAACEISDGHEVVTAATRERWSPMMKDFLAGTTALAEGRFDEAERLARGTIERARSAHELEPLASSLLLLGEARSRQGDSVGARSSLIEALRAGNDLRDDEVVVEAWLELVELVFFDRELIANLDGWMLGAELAAQHLAKDHPLQAQLAFKLGSAQLLRGQIDDALPRLETARAAFEREPDQHRYDIALVETSLGIAHMYRAEWEAARTALEHSLATWRSLPQLHPNLASTEGWIGELAVMQHDYAAAEPELVRAVESFEKLGEAGRSQLGKARFQLGYLYARTGRCDRARPLFAKARALAADASSALVGLVQLGDGTCELEAGHLAQAIALLESAARTRTPALLLQPAHTDFALARAIVKRDRPRALELATRARDDFAKFPGASADREVVDAWLAAQ